MAEGAIEGPRSLEPHEFESLRELLNTTFRSTGGCMVKDYPRLLDLDNKENLLVLTKNGKLISHCGMLFREVVLGQIQIPIVSIGAVATAKEEQGKGYATNVLNHGILKAKQRGAILMIISGDRGLYLRANAAFCGDFWMATIPYNAINDIPYVKSPNDEISLRRAKPSDIDQIISLFSTKYTRYLLPREDYFAVLNGAKVFDRDADWWIVQHKNEFIGVGALSVYQGVLVLLDWAGTTHALEHALPVWNANYKHSAFCFISSSKSQFPLTWSNYLQLRCTEGTVIVLKADEMWQLCKTRLEERLTHEEINHLKVESTNDYIRLSYKGGPSLEVKGQDLAFFFFGCEGKNFANKSQLPSSEELFGVLGRVFPLPMVWPGIGFV
eukprot:TRINITY_DN2592_c0_g3_i2.p1 TRINITY_DN2592_c0_g3~~TRINITY_DN2592_c0_g3_i2.p1  ORF type:complete len:396 (+),score=70.20 TRINITY_DN2592_c0_g3_i2:40-1188(+)